MGRRNESGEHCADDSDAVITIGKHILARYHEAADTVFMDGSTPWEIDEAMVDFGFEMGPYEAQDLAGIDIAFANSQEFLAKKSENRRKLPLVGRMLELGKLGKKTGAGWYRYPGGAKVDDPIVADLAIEESYFEKRTRTDYLANEIRERLLLAMINEACDLLEEGLAKTPHQVDQVSLQFLRFPPSKGGLMQYADTFGVAKIVSKLNHLSQEDPAAWLVSPYLHRTADSGSKLSDAPPSA